MRLSPMFPKGTVYIEFLAEYIEHPALFEDIHTNEEALAEAAGFTGVEIPWVMDDMRGVREG